MDEASDKLVCRRRKIVKRIDAALGAADQPNSTCERGEARSPVCPLPESGCDDSGSAAGPMPQPPTARECLAIINCSVHGRQIDYFLCPKCAAVQPTAATDDARDAARYRWLRDHSSGCDLGDAFDKTARVRIGRELFYAQTLDDALDKLRALDNTPDRPLCGYCHGFGTVPHYTYALQLDNGVTPGQTVMRTCPTCKGTGRG